MQGASCRYAMSAVLTAAAVLIAMPVRSDPVAGQSAPAFADALDLWLAGDEAAALPQLAALAQDDNRAAQILLGLIDTTPALQGDWLMALSRADRITLMRVPGGLSGQNWMREAAVTEPLAATWLTLWQGDAPMTVMIDFARQGEARAARIAAMTLARREKTGFAALADDPAYPAEVRAFAIREWQRSDPARAAQEAASLPPGDPQGEIRGLHPAAAETAAWLEANPGGDPLVALCAALCPGADQPACHAAAYQALGGYWDLMALGSPAEAVIPSSVFNRSAAGLNTTLYGLRHGRPTGLACLDTAPD